MSPSTEGRPGPTGQPAGGRGPQHAAPKRKRPPGSPRIPLKPKPGRFGTLVVHLPPDVRGSSAPGWGIAGLLAFGLIGAALWHESEKKPADEVPFLVEQEIHQAPPPPPPEPPRPQPKIKRPKTEPPPPKQFGLQKDELAPKSDMAVATGNTVNTKADSIVAPPPPPITEPIQVDVQAQVSGPIPGYPPKEFDRGIETTVIVEITIDANGLVTRVDIVKSGGSNFDASVKKSVWASRFTAPVIGGKKVPARFKRPYEFRIEG
jgi:protein TonB